MTVNCIIWLRVSDATQNELNQQPDLLAFCAENGLRPVLTVTAHGKSAWKAGRLDADKRQVLAALKSGLASVVVAWSVDRWSRGGISDLLDGMRAVRECGGRILFVKDSALNAEGPAQELLLAVLAWVAQWESNHKSDRTKAGMERRRAEGAIMGGHVPLGYRLADGVRVRDAAALAVVAEVFRRSAEGESTAVIAAWMRRSGYPRQDNTIADIIRNPLYVTDGVVSASLARAALEALEGRRSGTVRTTSEQDYSAMLTCPEPCAKPLYRIQSGAIPAKGIKPTRYYMCRGHDGKRPPMVRADDADRLIEHVMSGDTWPWTIPLRTGGDTREAQAAALRATLKNAKTRAESDAIWDEIERVLASEPEPETVTFVDSGETRGQHWERSTLAERRTWLESEGTRIVAWSVKENAGDEVGVTGHAWSLGKVRLVVEHGE